MPAYTGRVSSLNLRGDIVQLTRELCDIESVSGAERALADAIWAALEPLAHLELHRDGDAIVARTQLGRAQRVVIAGHIDTVPVNENLPCRLETIDGTEYLFGRGTVDMKAGIAVQLALAAELDAPNYDLSWIFYDHEEVDASLNGLGRLARHAPELLEGDFAVLCEPTSAQVEGGCNGILRFEIRTRGLRAHSARAWVGDNAIHKLGPALEILRHYNARTVHVDGLDYRESLSAVGIAGGVAGNVIPDAASLQINYRFAPNKTAAEAIEAMNDLFLDFDLTVVDQAEGARPGLDDPVAADFVRSVRAEAKPKYGWTDVARFSALGIPAVNYGPGDPLKAHADDEAVATAEIAACRDGLRRWLTGAK